MKIDIDVILNEIDKEVAFVNSRTKNVYTKIPLENFKKNPEGCVRALFESVMDYLDKGHEVNPIIIRKVDSEND